jgi:predicted MFS family arabinose efflux permease
MDRPGPFSFRSFRLLWTGQSINSVGGFVSTLALPLLAVTRLHASTFDVAALAAIEWVPAVLIGLPAGALTDRSRHKRLIMMAANVGQAVAIGSVPVTAALGVLSLGTLLAAAFTSGLFEVSFQTAYTPYLRSIVPEDQLVAANGWMQSSQSAAQVSGPPLGGLLVQAVGTATAVIADSVSFLLSLISLALIREDTVTPDARPERAGMRQEIGIGLRQLLGDPLLRTIATVAALANLLLTWISAVEVVFLARTVGVTPAMIGVIFAVSGAGGLAGAASASWINRRAGPRRVAQYAFLCTAPFTLLLPLTHRGPALAFFGIGVFAATYGIVLAGVTFAAIRQLCCPPALLGRVQASSRLLTAATIPVGSLIGGAVGQHFGTRTAILGGAIGYAVVGVIAATSPLRKPGAEARLDEVLRHQESAAAR